MIDRLYLRQLHQEVGGSLVVLISVYVCFLAYGIIIKSMLLSVIVWFGD